MTTPDAADNERRARIERVKEAGFAAISGRTIAKARAGKADEWASWWRREMEIHNSIDPAELLPDAFARLEQIAEDRARGAIHI